MAGAERFSMLLETQTRGTQEVEKLEAALQRVMAVAERSGKKTADATEKSAQAVRQHADQLRQAIASPLQGATSAVEDFVLGYGKFGLALTAGAIVVKQTAGAFVSLVNDTGNAAEQMLNFADRTGLSVNQVDKLQAQAKLAGVSIDALESSSKLLAGTLEDTGAGGDKAREAMRSLEVSLYDVKGGQIELGEVTLDLIKKLGGIKDASQQIALANATLGRGAKELIPLIRNYEETRDTVEKLGFGMDEYLLKRLSASADELDKVSLRWDLLKRQLAEPGIAVVEIVSKVVGFGKDTADRFGRSQRVTKETQYDVYQENIPRPKAPGLPETMLPGLLTSTNDLIKRQQAAEAYISVRLGTAEGQRRRIAEIESAITEADRKLVTNLDLNVRKNLGGQLRALQAEKAAIQANIKAAEEAEAERKRLEALMPKFEDRVNYGANFTRGSRAAAGLLGQIPLLVNTSAFMVSDADMTEANANGEAAASAQAQARIAGINTRQQLDRTRQLGVLQQTVDYQSRLVELTAGPGGEYAAVKLVTDLRLAALEKERELGTAQFELDMKRTGILQDKALKLLEIDKQREDGIRNAAGSVFDASLRGGAGIRELITSQMLVPLRTISQNLAVEIFKGTSGKLTIPGQKNADGTLNILGRALTGTPFGASAEHVAIDLNSRVTEANTMATVALTQALAGDAAGTGVGSFGSLVSGVSSRNSLIFHQNSGTRNGLLLDALDPSVAGLLGYKSGTSRLTKGVGIAGTLAAAGFGAYSGFSAGGAQGFLTGTSSLAGGAAGLLPLLGVSGPAAPIVGAVALGLGLAASFMGDPKKKRAEALQAEAERRRFDEPAGAAYTADIYGRQLDYDFQGRMRPIEVHHHYNISAVDTQSFADAVRRNGVEVAEVVTATIGGGNADDLVGTLGQALGLRG